MSVEEIIKAAEASIRANTGIAWDFHDGTVTGGLPFAPDAQEKLLATCDTGELDGLPASGAHVVCLDSMSANTAGRDRLSASSMQTRSSDGKPGVTDGRDGLPARGVHAALLHDKPTDAPAKVLAARRTCGCAYSFDGSLEGLLSAIHAAIHAHDAQAEIVDSSCVQPRLGQELVDCATDIENATKVRRLIEYSLGAQAFRCIRAVASSGDEERGTAIYRFLAHAIPASGRTGCNTCARKASCTRACSSPASCPQLDDLAEPATFKLMSLYRSVMNERHYMVQFIRFEHCEGDVWFARCNPKASVVPLIMDWFIPRFNDQRFVIYDENHALSGVWDGRRWYLVAGSDITPPPRAGDERMMQAAWRRFYRSVSLDARYHPELRRSFMPMRLWRNLTEMQPE